jgi:TonB family protein
LPAGFRVSYPEGAKAARLRETVRVAVLIDETGRVVVATGLDENAANAPFIKAAVLALREARFQPGQAAGQAVKSKAIVAVRFSYE